jgi:PAS domain S-box-containing protein
MSHGERPRSLLDGANDAILIVSADGRIVDANGTAEQFYGYPRSALLGKHVLRDLRPPEEQAPGESQLAVAWHEGRVVFETQHLAADGSRIPVEVSSSRVQDATGDVLVSVVRDVRERHAARQRIARLNRLLRTLSSANELLVRIESEDRLLIELCQAAIREGGFQLAWVGRAAPDGRVVPVASAGPATAYLADITVRWDDSPLATGPTGRAIRERRTFIVGDTTADPAAAPWRDALARAGFRSSAASPILLRDQAFGALNLYSTEPDFFDAEVRELLEKLAGDLGFGLQAQRDRRQLLESEKAVAEQRRLLERITQVSPLAIYLYDLDAGRDVYSNRRTVGMLGYRDDEIDLLDPGTLRHLFHPDDLARAAEWMARYASAADGDVIDLEFRLRHKDGEYRWMEARHVIFSRHADGRPKQILGVSQDVTERRRLQEQFLQAQKMESIGRLAGGVAHDFNNLLTAIIGYTELLKLSLPADHPGQASADEIMNAGTRAAALTAQLLAFARRQVVEPRVVDVNAAVADAERMLRRIVAEDVDLVTALDPETGGTLIDPGQLQQVLVNLVVNARDSMPDGGRLVIETAPVLLDEAQARAAMGGRPGRYAMVAVSDTGAGIPPDVRAHLFEPFFTTKELGKGTGLGLATCHGIVTQAGGHISVFSEEGLGTTFRVYLPHVMSGPCPQVSVDAVPPASGRETVLLVEDDAMVRPLAALGLRSHGYRVIDAPNARDAIALARAHAPDIDLLVTDVVMPGLGGRELAQEIARWCPRARVLFMSGHPESAIAHQGVLEDGVNFLPKPFTPERLARRVRAVLDAR